MKKSILRLGIVLNKMELKLINGSSDQRECESKRDCTWYECWPGCICGHHLPPC
ncbi:hypothetical protein [Tenacibaculum discolor]|uniref:hypothetical protein n=1 Tax=Tenacibaculum discolor TaxID=361581 RepID=UPI003F792BB0